MESNVAQRYADKIKVICDTDSYTLKFADLSADEAQFPAVTYVDIVNYFIFKRNAYTVEQFRAYKSLQAYNFFVSGWVLDVRVKVFDNKASLVMGKVLHSQKLSEPPLIPWVITSDKAEVISGHCMAHLGEACSHVGAILFFLDQLTRRRIDKFCTEVAAKWVVPKQKKVAFKKIRDIDFSTLTTSKNKKLSVIEESIRPSAAQKTSEDTFSNILKKLDEHNTNSGILTIVLKPTSSTSLFVASMYADLALVSLSIPCFIYTF